MSKQIQILDSAASCFLKLGFTETSMDSIVSASGVVKQTLYNRYENKELLFKSAVEHIMRQISAENLDYSLYRLEAHEFFLRLGKIYLRSLANPQNLAFLRLIVKECRRFPELQDTYAQSLPKPFIDFVQVYLQGKFAVPADLAQAIAWSFRAALSGYASLSNLARLLRSELAPRAIFLHELSTIFCSFCSDLAADENKARLLIAEEPSKQEDKPFKETENISLIGLLILEPEAAQSKRTTIMEAAFKLFCSKGYAETSMDEVTALANVSKATVYKHFKSKKILFDQIFGSLQKQLETESNTESIAPGQDILSYTEKLSGRILGNLNKSAWREYFRMVFGEAASFPLESAMLLVFLMDNKRSQLEEALKQSGLTQERAQALALCLRSILGSYILLSQIYILGQTPYLNGKSLASLNTALLKANLK